jgi:hypothetical protein
MTAFHRPSGAWQSAHRGGGVGTPRAGAARAAHPAAGADGPISKHAYLCPRGSAAAPLAGWTDAVTGVVVRQGSSGSYGVKKAVRNRAHDILVAFRGVPSSSHKKEGGT